jgi:hypothetical protein
MPATNFWHSHSEFFLPANTSGCGQNWIELACGLIIFMCSIAGKGGLGYVDRGAQCSNTAKCSPAARIGLLCPPAQN